jgi:hypothetical protein
VDKRWLTGMATAGPVWLEEAAPLVISMERGPVPIMSLFIENLTRPTEANNDYKKWIVRSEHHQPTDEDDPECVGSIRRHH